jgi:hypothetical protein
MSYLNGTAQTIDASELAHEELDGQLKIKRQLAIPSTVADRLRIALGDYRNDKRALQRVISICSDKCVLPVTLVEKRVNEAIEIELRRRVEWVLQS